MNYDGLSTSYWESQIERIMIVRDRIAGAHTVQAGRVMPSEDDLAIGTGKLPLIGFDNVVRYNYNRIAS